MALQGEDFMGPLDKLRTPATQQPSPGVVAYWGYLGPALAPPENPPATAPDDKPEDRWRLYFNPHLTEYVEFKFVDMVAQQAVNSGPNSPLGGHMVWLKAEARVQFVRVTTLSSQAGFLQGPIAGIPAQPTTPGRNGALAPEAGSAGCGTLTVPCTG